MRGESVKKALISPVIRRECPPHLTLPSPLPPGAERECLRPLAGHPAVYPVILAAWLGAALLPRVAFAAPLSVEKTPQTVEWTVSHQGRKLLVYSFAPQKFKPYVKELGTITGDNILRDSPFDHLHHHALMYAIKVNGINFWEEVPGCGVEKPITTSAPELGVDAQGRPRAVIRQTLHWLAAQDAFLHDTTPAALLIEQRTLTLTVDESAREVALQWKSAFKVGAKTNEVTLTGANYHGLGMRFLQEFDPIVRHLNAGGAPDLKGRQDVSKHGWGSVSFDRPGKPVTLVLMGHPSNARGDAWFFTMREPFAYLSATQNLDKEPLVYRSGQTFELNYLLTVYPELKPADAINQRAQSWQTAKP